MFLSLLLAGSMLAGCGKKEATENISVITASSEEGYATNMMKEAAEKYAADNNLIYQNHSVAGADEEDCLTAMEEAAQAGADVILCYGESFEIPLYTIQKKYKNVKYIIMDGTPRKAAGKKYQIRKNTRAVLYAEAQAGFLAGYAAVQDGYKNLGFMGGVPNESIIRYGSGFVQGANYAAKEMNLAADKITIRYAYQGTNEISPALMSVAGSWYDEGCEVIFACGGSLGTAVMKAAEQKDKKVIGVISDQSEASDTVITSAVKEIRDTVYNAIGTVYDKSFKGKKADVLDIASGGVSLSMNTSRFETFDQKKYSAVTAKITDGGIEISMEDIEKLQEESGTIDNITLNME